MLGMDDDVLIGVPRSTASRVIGVPERRLRDWNTAGLVYPSHEARVGRSLIWTYSLEDLVQGRVVRELEDRGIHVRVIRRIVESVRMLQQVLDLDVIRSEARARLARPAESYGRIERRTGVHGSRPVFAGTRIPVDTVRAYIEREIPDDEIFEAFPVLAVEDLEIARQHLAAAG